MIDRTAKLDSGKEIKKIIGIESSCYIRKSTIDDPYRTANISILFNYGLDDVRQNLQYIKDMTKDSQYDCFDKKYQSMERAIQYIEENRLQKKLRNSVIDFWEAIEKKFELKRTPKVRW
jgi:hypothetical protein